MGILCEWVATAAGHERPHTMAQRNSATLEINKLLKADIPNSHRYGEQKPNTGHGGASGYTPT